MERFNPFAAEDDPEPFGVGYDRGGGALAIAGSKRAQPPPPPPPPLPPPLARHQSALRSNSTSSSSSTSRYVPNFGDQSATNATVTASTNRYSTKFPDPFGESTKGETDTDLDEQRNLTGFDSIRSPLVGDRQENRSNIMTSNNSSSSLKNNNRSSSITFAPSSAHSVDESSALYGSPTATATATTTTTTTTMRNSPASRQSSGFSSFLSRATSVTSSSVTDRVSEAVGSVRSAVDSLSNQIQQAVPSNINERITTTATSLIGSSTDQTQQQQQQQQQPQQSINQQQPQQSAASYLASKITSATGKFTSSGSSSSSMPVISRQRVILVIDALSSADWALQFNNYRRLTSGASSSASQSAITSFFSSATAQLTASSSSNLEGDLVEQADFRDVSVLANQATSTATILIGGQSPTSRAASTAKSSLSSSMSNSIVPRVVRPEYVVVRQRTKERSDHLRSIVNALNYCLVPMFEPSETWNTFQDRQLVFAKLLRVQKRLGRENFPLIPQVYCQTHQDLLNHLNSSSVTLPCLMRTGPYGKGKIRIENLQMLKDFASIMATSSLSCTFERYLEVKCDLVVQKLGTNLKLFRKIVPQTNESGSQSIVGYSTDERINLSGGVGASGSENHISQRQSVDQQNQQFVRQPASRQTSIGSSVLSNFISSTTNATNQQLLRQSSNPVNDSFEKLSDVNTRYRNWIDGIMREFDNKLEAFCIKIAVTTDDREYIVGLNDCSMEFLGNLDNQEEDRRSFVELIISNMNTVLPKTHQNSDQQMQTNTQTSDSIRCISDVGQKQQALFGGSSTGLSLSSMQQPPIDSSLGDRKKFISQTQIDGPTKGSFSSRNGQTVNRNYGQLSSRSQSVSMNQSDYLIDETPINKSAFFNRRGSDRSDSLSTTEVEDLSISQDSQSPSAGQSSAANLHQRQASLGQSIFDQTSTAFNSLQKQSLSFFKRLDARSSNELNSNTPPQSAKSDRGFDGTFVASNSNEISNANNRPGFKSQSMDCSTLERSGSMREGSLHRRTPPKPPPPQSMSYRQSSLVSNSARRNLSNSTTPHPTPDQTRQNSSAADTIQSATSDCITSQRGKIVRQNSAMSAFEKLESEMAASSNQSNRATNESSLTGSRTSQRGISSESSNIIADKPLKSFDSVKKSVNFDSVSITSGDSNSTGETTTAEDTMNNLKKTFASIFGDKCE